VQERGAHHRAGLLAHPAEQQRGEEYPQAPELEDGQVAQREQHRGHPEGRAQPHAEHHPAFRPGVAQAGLHEAAVEELLGQGDHEVLVDHPLHEPVGQPEREVRRAGVRREQPLHGERQAGQQLREAPVAEHEQRGDDPEENQEQLQVLAPGRERHSVLAKVLVAPPHRDLGQVEEAERGDHLGGRGKDDEGDHDGGEADAPQRDGLARGIEREPAVEPLPLPLVPGRFGHDALRRCSIPAGP
jgi:hypothetical protein